MKSLVLCWTEMLFASVPVGESQDTATASGFSCWCLFRHQYTPICRQGKQCFLVSVVHFLGLVNPVSVVVCVFSVSISFPFLNLVIFWIYSKNTCQNWNLLCRDSLHMESHIALIYINRFDCGFQLIKPSLALADYRSPKWTIEWPS